MAYTFDEIVEMVRLLQADQGPLIARMREVQFRYDGDYHIPMPELATEPTMPNLTPALVGEAIDQIALRAASTTPSIFSPPIDPKKDTGRRSRAYATTRSQIIQATLEQSRWKLGRRRYYRQLVAYHTASMVVLPNMARGLPTIEVRDPLSSYVEPQAAESLADPNYAAFINRYSGAHLRKCYPVACYERGGPITSRDTHKMWEVVEWYDCEETVWGLLGPVEAWGDHMMMTSSRMGDGSSGRVAHLELARLPNRAGCLPVCVPHNVSLGRISSRIGSLLGNVDLQARMMALHITASEKAIFPDTYVIGESNEAPQLVSGAWKDGRTGEVNLIQNATAVGVLRTSPDPASGQMVDRLERNFRASTSLVPQLGGETYGAMRTGRAIDALSGMALDPRVQEAHEITESYQATMHKAILGTYKGYWGSKKFSMYSGSAAARVLVEFTPNEHIETTENSVSYFIAGADAMQLTQILGSMFGAGAIARRTFQEQHPMIGNADAEEAQIREEKIEGAVLQGFEQGLISGQIPLAVAAIVRREILKGTDLVTAVEKAHEEMQKRQAQVPPVAPEGMVAAPETMPGLAAGPAQAPAEPEPQVQVPGDAARMRQLIQTMGG